jgi:transcriptional regulator with XRE-family HTH domain
MDNEQSQEVSCRVPKTTAKKVRRAEVMSEMQARLLGDIERALDVRKMTKTALAAAGGPTQQVIDRWAHGASPTLRTLEKLAAALSSELIVAIPGVSDPPATVLEYLEDRHMSDDAMEIADLLTRMDDAERKYVLGYLRGRMENSRRPSEPVAERKPGRARSSANSGPTT